MARGFKRRELLRMRNFRCFAAALSLIIWRAFQSLSVWRRIGDGASDASQSNAAAAASAAAAAAREVENCGIRIRNNFDMLIL